MILFMAIAVLWLMFFIQEKTGFIAMASAASFYFTSTREAEGSASVSTAFNLVYMKHAGSIALGSGLHTIIAILRGAADSA